MSEETVRSSVTTFRAKLREKGVFVRWVVTIPFCVTVLVAGVLTYLCYFAENTEHFLPPELFIMAASFGVYVVSIFVGMIMAVVLLLLRKRRPNDSI